MQYNKTQHSKAQHNANTNKAQQNKLSMQQQHIRSDPTIAYILRGWLDTVPDYEKGKDVGALYQPLADRTLTTTADNNNKRVELVILNLIVKKLFHRFLDLMF